MNNIKAKAVRFIIGLSVLLPIAVVATPTIEHWQTANGVGVYFVAAPEIPIVDLRVIYHAGSARDDTQAGIANLTSGLLSEGADDLDANAFNARIADTGATFSTGALRDMAWISMRTMLDPKYSTTALELFKKVVAKPRFDEAAVERLKANTIIDIQRAAQSPGTVANKTIYREIFGDHPYGSPKRGTEESVKQISLQDVTAFHSRYYVDANAVIAIVGALTIAKAKEISEEIASKIPAGEPPPPISTPQAKTSETATVKSTHVEFPSIQSHIRIGHLGMKRGDDDYFPLLVGNHVLGGGGLVSLLFDEVREKRGLSYSVNSYFSPMATLGPFIASLQTDSSQAPEALNVLRETIRDFIENGPPAARLEAAKQNLIGGFPLRIDSNSKILEYIGMIGFYELPLDYLATFPQRVAAVSAADIQSAFERRLNLDALAIVTVGKSVQP